jgi:ribosomal protein S15P/S13E
MARKGSQKRKSNYTNATRIKNRIRRLTKHISKHPNDQNAQKAINIK